MIEHRLQYARVYLKDGRDNKAWVYLNDFQFLLEADAKPITQNSLEKEDGRYTQEVRYAGIVFQTATKNKIVYL